MTSDPGSPSTSKIGLTWRPIETLLVRGSWGETFRAPSVFDLYAGGQENEAMVPDAKAMFRRLEVAGGGVVDKVFVEIPEGRHNESSWRAVLPAALCWRFAPICGAR